MLKLLQFGLPDWPFDLRTEQKCPFRVILRVSWRILLVVSESVVGGSELPIGKSASHNKCQKSGYCKIYPRFKPLPGFHHSGNQGNGAGWTPGLVVAEFQDTLGLIPIPSDSTFKGGSGNNRIRVR